MKTPKRRLGLSPYLHSRCRARPVPIGSVRPERRAFIERCAPPSPPRAVSQPLPAAPNGTLPCHHGASNPGQKALYRSYTPVLAFDFLGHGRNPVPMSGDVTAVDGTTALLVDETRRMIAAGRHLAGTDEGVALLGHSIASDIIVRAAGLERRAGTPIDAVVAISMFSPAVTATEPTRLLAISGEWEGTLRAAALDALRLVSPSADEGETVQNEGIARRAAVAPNVEHRRVDPVAACSDRRAVSSTRRLVAGG